MNETGTQHYTPQRFQSPSYLQSTDSKLVTQIYLCCLDAGVVGNTQNIITDQVKGCVLARGSLISHGVGKVQGHISICIKVSPYKHQMSTSCTCTCLWTVIVHVFSYFFIQIRILWLQTLRKITEMWLTLGLIEKVTGSCIPLSISGFSRDIDKMSDRQTVAIVV